MAKNEKSTSILAKVSNTVSGVGEFLGRGKEVLSKGVKALSKGAIYPIWPKNWFKSWDEIGHDIKNGWRYAIDKPLEEYDPPIKTTQASEDLGVQITEQKKGTEKVSFLASRALTGDIPYLTPKQLGEIKQNLPNVTIFKEENKVVIEVNVEDIIKKVKEDNPGMDEKIIKKHVLKKIYDEVDHNLKGLAKITGGEFKVHTDQKLLHGIAEKLYREYDNQKQSFEIVRPTKPVDNEKPPKQSSESIEESFNITNPNGFPFGKSKEAISPTKIQLSQDMENQVREWGSALSNCVGVSDKPDNPLSLPAVDQEKAKKSPSR
ncbi:MAG: hypothetical protein LBV62_03375 [Rickettsiales bacterium]|jgi:hypothetical protein|nr:hypothetical protein [Rickettsiales bacterium]